MSHLFNVSRIFNNARFSQKIAVLYRTVLTDESGDLVNHYESEKRVTAIVHPTGANDVALLSEAERYLPSKKIFSLSPLSTGDIFIYQGEKWRISTLGNWSEYGFYNAIGILHEGTQKPLAPSFELK